MHSASSTSKEKGVTMNKIKLKRLIKRLDWRIRADNIANCCFDVNQKYSNVFINRKKHVLIFSNYYCGGMVNPPTIDVMLSIHILELAIKEFN